MGREEGEESIGVMEGRRQKTEVRRQRAE